MRRVSPACLRTGFLCLIVVVSAVSISHARKTYKGAEYRTKAAYLYGRFEVRMKATGREGTLASFFTYNDQYPNTPWNEIDIEILGRYTDDVQFNTITPGQVNHVSHYYTNFNPASDYYTYTFEWTPEYVAWFVDSVEVYRQTGAHVASLNQPQKIMMNIWNPIAENWAGKWNEMVLPANAFYDWVRYASYTPGAGSVGSGRNFTPQWFDDFDSWDQTRWDKASHTFGGNNSDFVHENAVFQNGKLILCLTKDNATGHTDTAPPSVLSVRTEGNTLRVIFSEEIEKSSAETAANYLIPNATVMSARLLDDQKTVLLSVSGLDTATQSNLILHNIRDRWTIPNAMPFQAFPIIRTTPLTFPIKLNIGGNAVLGYLPDQVWSESVEYGRMDGQTSSFATAMITGTTDQEIYRTEVYDLCEYKVRVPNGRYLVTLIMAENYFTSPNQRTTNIVVEGTPVETNLDLVGRFGFRVAYARSIFVNVNDGVLDLHFQGVIDKPLLNGLTISQVSTAVSEGQDSGLDNRSFVLQHNYPNPFNGQTAITFSLPEDDHLTLRVYDALGRTVNQRDLGEFKKGESRIFWEAKSDEGASLSSGVYYYRVQGRISSRMQKTVYVK